MKEIEEVRGCLTKLEYPTEQELKDILRFVEQLQKENVELKDRLDRQLMSNLDLINIAERSIDKNKQLQKENGELRMRKNLVLKSCDNNESNNDYAIATDSVRAMLTDYSLLNNKEI